MDFSHLRLVAHHQEALAEFRSYGLMGLRMEKDNHLRVVDAQPQAVALYKALDAGDNRIVENVVLYVEGREIATNMQYNHQNLRDFIGLKDGFEVFVVVNRNRNIEIYNGFVDGFITLPNPAKGFTVDNLLGFENMFTPTNSVYNLYELYKMGRDGLYSPRRIAVENLLGKNPLSVIPVAEVKPWSGSYRVVLF